MDGAGGKEAWGRRRMIVTFPRAKVWARRHPTFTQHSGTGLLAAEAGGDSAAVAFRPVKTVWSIAGISMQGPLIVERKGGQGTEGAHEAPTVVTCHTCCFPRSKRVGHTGPHTLLSQSLPFRQVSGACLGCPSLPVGSRCDPNGPTRGAHRGGSQGVRGACLGPRDSHAGPSLSVT